MKKIIESLLAGIAGTLVTWAAHGPDVTSLITTFVLTAAAGYAGLTMAERRERRL